MDLNFDLNLIESQKLLLTPYLKQEIDVLKMSCQELNDYVEDLIETNPALEYIDETGEQSESEVINFDTEDYYDSIDSGWKYQSINEHKSDVYELNDFWDNAVDDDTIDLSLKEHLRFQLNISGLNKKLIAIGEYIIGNIDQNGYMTLKLSEIASSLKVPLNTVKIALKLLQGFDPPGVCARNLKECLMLQLKQMDNIDKNIYKVVESHLDDLANNRISEVAKDIGISLQKTHEIYKFIKTLEPKPGREFFNCVTPKYTPTDCFIKRINGEHEVIINEEAYPFLNISSYYRKVVNEDINHEAKKFIISRINSASWLIKCIELRKNTIKRIVECIVKKQRDFFDSGKGFLRQIDIKDVAKETEIHVTALNKIINRKYLQCRWGVFELKYFFYVKTLKSQGDYSSKVNAKEMIKQLIIKEDKKAPLKDRELVILLGESSFKLSRQTVARYRAELKIQSSSKRKK
ncbi:MAG: RNA polymerase factor sigma-54 [Bacillota bacterium]|nr:RNA polymerase factor sigma-54 [Bacillota bacterium]